MKPIHSMNDITFDRVYEIMKASFPNIERRTYAGQKALLQNKHYRLLTESDDDGNILAFLAAWEFPTFQFVEHIAVDPQTRGGGIGGQLMTDFLAQSPSPVVLEVEPPVTELQKRRVGFYERLGFLLNDYAYVQPPLQQGLPDLPLMLMSNPRLLTVPEFERCRETLYQHVYGINI
jgi:ribosomal protein S18 acetylase RimI-like enzyme